MNGPNDHYSHRWRLHGQEELAAIPLDEPAFPAAQAVLQFQSQRVGFDLRLPNKTLLAGCDVGHEDGGAPRGALCVEIRQKAQAHEI
jgi:hypothetical protein